MTYIKILTALTALALLTACGSPTVNIGEVNINNGALCDTNPYGANCGEEFETPRQTIASGCRTDDSGALCEDATTFVCDKNFDDMLCDDITEYVDQREVVMEQCTDTKTQKACDEEDRITACDANEFATDCAEQKYVDKRRMTCSGDKTATRCMPTVDLICGADGDIFDDFCTGLTDTDTMRANACQTHGTDAGGDDSCAASLASSCTITDPFIYAGCKDVAGIAGVRMMYCQTPANAWDAECMDITHGAVDTTRMTACEMFGTDTGTGGDTSCANSLISVCLIANPFIHEGCDDVVGIDAGVRTMFCEMPANAWNPKCMQTTHGAVNTTRVTACQMFGTDTGTGGHTSCATSLAGVCLIANPFIHEGCDDVVGIDAGLRKTFCETPATAWNPKCMDTTHGAVTTTRMTACEMFGTDTGMGGDDSCATSLISVCLIANPFIHEGCDDVVGIDAGLRKTFCETPATAWNPKCMDTTHGAVTTTRMTACEMFGTDTGTGGHTSCATSLAGVCLIANPFIHEGCDDVVGIDAGLRKTFCETPANAWNPKCMDGMHGTVNTTRVTACQMFGTDTGMGGDDSCAASLASSCTITNPFIHEGCDDVTDIDSGVRTMFCEMPANAWNPKCMDTTHGTVNATRVTACQMFGTDTGTGGDDSCANSLISVCLLANPFIHAGCDDVTDIDSGVRTMFCEMPANAWNPKCMDTTHGTVNATRMTACQMFGTGTGGDDSCATSLAGVCLIANPFIHEGCDDVVGIDAGVRTMFCEMPANAWNPKCMDTTHGTVTATRMTACEMFGTGMGGDDSCATSLISVCLIANPFIHAGCDDVTDIDSGVRTMFCEMPANAWNPKCMDTTHGTVNATRVTACEMFGTDTGTGGDDSCATSLISVCLLANPFIHEGCNDVVGIDAGLRKTFCETPANAWNPKCMDTTHGTVIATRMTACQMFGTGTGGHATCAASLASVCNDIANPFIHAGCDDVAGIDAGVRTMYCQMSANAWNPKCMDTTHGTVTATRGDACLEFGIDTTRGGHRSCVRNTLAESSCASNPFDPANPGCAILTKFEMIVRTYCKANHLAGCPTATYDAWVASFPDNAPLLASNLAPTAGNKFLQGKETGLNTTGLGDFTADSFNFQTATYNGMLFGGSPTNGVAFQYGNIGGKRYFYAGLLSGTDLGPPLTTVTNAMWYGRIVVLQNRAWYLTPAGKVYGDIDLTVNYDGNNNGTIRGSYDEYTVNGTFDSKGIMGGNVTRSKIGHVHEADLHRR